MARERERESVVLSSHESNWGNGRLTARGRRFQLVGRNGGTIRARAVCSSVYKWDYV